MWAKRQIKINRKKKEPEVEVKNVTLEEAIDEITEEPVIEEESPVTTVVENEISNEQIIGFTKSQVKWEIVWSWGATVVQQPRGRIKFEAQLAAVPMFKLPEDIRRYLTSHGLPTNVWKWDKERLEKKKVDMEVVEKLKKFLSSMS